MELVLFKWAYGNFYDNTYTRMLAMYGFMNFERVDCTDDYIWVDIGKQRDNGFEDWVWDWGWCVWLFEYGVEYIV